MPLVGYTVIQKVESLEIQKPINNVNTVFWIIPKSSVLEIKLSVLGDQIVLKMATGENILLSLSILDFDETTEGVLPVEIYDNLNTPTILSILTKLRTWLGK